MKTDKTFTLRNDQTGEYTLPVLDGIEGPSVIDGGNFMERRDISHLIRLIHQRCHVNLA